MKSWFVPTLRIDSTDQLADIIARLNDFQPRSLLAYANMAKMLAQEQIKGKLTIYPEVVFCASEVLTDDTRKLINQAWNIQPFNVYAATETAGIASECAEHRGLHLYEDMVIPEVVDGNNSPVKPGEYGAKILVTVLFSRTLPLIRYEISDSVRLFKEQCACGRSFALLDDIQGRMEEIIYLTGSSGEKIPIQPNFFHNIMESYPLGGWQIIQKENNLLKIIIVKSGENFDETHLVKTVSGKLTEQGVNNPFIKVEYVASLQRRALGKIFLIKSL